MFLPRALPAWALALLTAGSGACAGPATPAANAPERGLARAVEPDAPRPAEVAVPAPPPWAGTAALASNAGSYVIQYRPGPGEMPWGEPFDLRVWVLGNGPEPAPLEQVALSVDAAMPEHGHGMNRVPVVTASGDGGFAVEGLLLHMPGRWELYFDVTQGALTERAQTEVVLE